MNTRSVNSAAGVILAAMQQNRTPAGIALALESAGLLMSPESVADLQGLLDKAYDDLTGTSLSLHEEQQETARLRLALKSAQRGRREMRSQRDEFCDRVDTLTAVAKGNKRHVQSLFAELQTMQRERDEARARVAELEKERARYVGAEPTIAEELAYLSRCLDAVLNLCEQAEQQATRWETPLPVPEWVAEVRAAAEGMVKRTSYPPAMPWARLMDEEDLCGFLDDLADAVGTVEREGALVEIEDVCARWRLIAEAQHGHNTAAGEETTR